MRKQRTALVTGGFGYVGGYLVDLLLTKGWKVHVLDTFFTSVRQRLTKGVYVQNAPTANVDAVMRSMKDVDAIFHLATRYDESTAPRHLLRIAKTNIEGTAVVLTLAHACGVNNIVLASTAAVYGDLGNGLETDYVEPISVEGATMLAAEALAHYHNAAGLEVKVLRLFNVWGRKPSRSIVNKFANGCKTVFIDGGHTRDYVYIDDAVNALYNAVVWEPGVYNIGTGDEVTTLGLFRMLRDDEPQFEPEPPGTIYRSIANMENTFARTKWQAKVHLCELSRDEILERCNVE